MKKSIFIAVLGVGSVLSSYGQGQIAFANYFSSTQTSGIKYGSGPALGMYAGNEMSAILLFGASTATSIAQLTAVPSSAAPCGFPGAGPSSGNAANQGIFNNVNPVFIGAGTFAFAYEATGTYQGLQYIGFSGIVTAATQASNQSPIPSLQTLFGPMNVLVNPVPEPTTLALVGLGGLASLVALRRKQS